MSSLPSTGLLLLLGCLVGLLLLFLSVPFFFCGRGGGVGGWVGLGVVGWCEGRTDLGWDGAAAAAVCWRRRTMAAPPAAAMAVVSTRRRGVIRCPPSVGSRGM